MKIDIDTTGLDDCLAILDREFERYTLEAWRLADEYLRDRGEDKSFLHALISVVEDKRYRSTAIRWVRISPAPKGSNSKTQTHALPKGRNTHRYPESAFKFLEPAARARVLIYEERLEVLRFSLSKNRSAHTNLRNIKTAMDKRLAPFQEEKNGW